MNTEIKLNSRQRAIQWPFQRHRVFSDQLRECAARWFQDKKLLTHPHMKYCLASRDQWRSNIILEEVAQYIETMRAEALKASAPFPLHKYLHHGMSSQAMAFNLIGPLITRKDFAPLMAVLQSKNVPGSDAVSEAVFEYEDREVFNEDAGQPTSIDIALKDKNGKPFIFIECKFEEKEFGGCSVFEGGDCSGMNPVGEEDACFLHFIGRKYWQLMTKHGITDELRSERQCIFAMHYQFFREVMLAIEKDGTFVLLSDERSPVFHGRAGEQERGLLPFLTSFLPSDLKSRVVWISIQELIGEIERRPEHQDWVLEFKKKYGMA